MDVLAFGGMKKQESSPTTRCGPNDSQALSWTWSNRVFGSSEQTISTDFEAAQEWQPLTSFCHNIQGFPHIFGADSLRFPPDL